ncbi:MAG: hypothetical protein M5U26_27830 [Planctomycetota bacterium]|nr:hypothetical protein [Planctomycetota bacterium]
MDTPRKRRWFQLHLSTCVALMIVAGLILWSNMRPGSAVITLARPPIKVYGWPWTIANQPPAQIENEHINLGAYSFYLDGLEFTNQLNALTATYGRNLVWNVLVALAILAAVALPLEYLARRSER